MDYSKLATFDFLFSLGYVTLGSSIITLIFTGIIKSILKAIKVITPNMDSTKKDVILSRTGRIVALVVYATLYVVDVLLVKKNALVVDITLFTSLISGSTLTLCISKGFYTGLRQMSKKTNVFDKLEVAQKTIFTLQNQLKESCFEQETVVKDSIEPTDDVVINPLVRIDKESAIDAEHKPVLNVRQEAKRKNKWVIKGE